MIRNTRIILLLAVALMPISCAPANRSQPKWVSQPHTDYPADRYLVGVATGENCDDAVDRAIARLSQQVEVEVTAMETHRRLINEISSFDASSLILFDTRINLESNTTLLGVEIVETRPLGRGSCAARAVLEIDRSLALYEEAITQRSASIRSMQLSADRADREWNEFIAVASALRLSIEHDQLAMTQRVIAGRAGRELLLVDLRSPEFLERYSALLETISISAVPVGDCPPMLIDRAESALTEHDIPVERDFPGSIQLRIGWSEETKQTFDPRWWSCRWRISVTLYDAVRGETLATSAPQAVFSYGLSNDAALEAAIEEASDAIGSAVGIVLRNPNDLSP